MIIYVFIYIKCLGGIKATVKRQVIRNSGGTYNTHEMRTTHHAVKMDDRHSQTKRKRSRSTSLRGSEVPEDDEAAEEYILVSDDD